ncbi:MAG TPA: zinc metallopeptidase [Kofleriaceae bacterium]
MVELLGSLWPLLLLMYVPSLLATVMRIVITRALRRLDESHPDDLEHTAGTWLAHELARLGLGDRVKTIVTDKEAKLSLDAYHPFHGVIQLSADTHFKRDPMHWAIAAHELGHARFHLGWPVLARIIITALYIKRALIPTGVALVLGNIAFALPHLTSIAFALFVISVGLHLFVLLDELVASAYAMQSLRASPTFSSKHMRSADRMLALAFATYLFGFATRLLLLSQWHLVEQLTRHALVPPLATLTTFGFVLAAIVSTVLVVAVLWRIVKRYLDPIGLVNTIGVIAELLAKPALIVLVLLIWNVRADVGYAWNVILALITIQPYFVIMLMLPIILIDIFVVERFARQLVVDITHRTSQLIRDYEAGRAERRVGNLAIADVINKWRTSPPLEHRMLHVLHYSYLPLLITFWLS